MAYKLCILIVAEDDHKELMITEAAHDFKFGHPMSLVEVKEAFEMASEDYIVEEERTTEMYANYLGLPIPWMTEIISEGERKGLTDAEIRKNLDKAKVKRSKYKVFSMASYALGRSQQEHVFGLFRSQRAFSEASGISPHHIREYASKDSRNSVDLALSAKHPEKVIVYPTNTITAEPMTRKHRAFDYEVLENGEWVKYRYKP